MILWTKLFLNVQGYEVKENTMMKEKNSAIILDNN